MYEDDKKIDKWIYFNDKGEIRKEEKYQNGEIQEKKEWHPNGNEWKKYKYKDGKLNGKCIEYYKNGEKSSIQYWLSGKKDSDWIYYYDNGKVKETFMYDMDIIHGKREKYFYSGQIHMRRNYKNGVMEGLYEEWRMRGLKKNRSRGKMKNGEMDGKWTYWHPNGHKECEVVCKNGELIDGKVWDDDGNKKESLRFNLTWEGSDALQDI